jgi:hypothetical protein
LIATLIAMSDLQRNRWFSLDRKPLAEQRRDGSIQLDQKRKKREEEDERQRRQ